jgi:hypothetical protein
MKSAISLASAIIDSAYIRGRLAKASSMETVITSQTGPQCPRALSSPARSTKAGV